MVTNLILTANGEETGCGEMKPTGTSEQLANEDRVRIGEVMKRQVHRRIMTSKDIKELKTLGVIIDGFDIKLYFMAFEPKNTSCCYQFYQIETLKLPNSWVHNIQQS